MPCPNCNSNDLWDDQLAWGCNSCTWLTTGSVQNKISPCDRFDDPSLTRPAEDHDDDN